MPNDERNLETIPDGILGLIPLESCRELGIRVDQYLVGVTGFQTCALPILPT